MTAVMAGHDSNSKLIITSSLGEKSQFLVTSLENGTIISKNYIIESMYPINFAFGEVFFMAINEADGLDNGVLWCLGDLRQIKTITLRNMEAPISVQIISNENDDISVLYTRLRDDEYELVRYTTNEQHALLTYNYVSLWKN